MALKTFAIQTMLMQEHEILTKAIREVGGNVVLQDVFEIPADKEDEFQAILAASYKGMYGYGCTE